MELTSEEKIHRSAVKNMKRHKNLITEHKRYWGWMDAYVDRLVEMRKATYNQWMKEVQRGKRPFEDLAEFECWI